LKLVVVVPAAPSQWHWFPDDATTFPMTGPV
jgi:hypothetical protein